MMNGTVYVFEGPHLAEGGPARLRVHGHVWIGDVDTGDAHPQFTDDRLVAPDARVGRRYACTYSVGHIV
jgi:hypothetical protein